MGTNKTEIENNYIGIAIIFFMSITILYLCFLIIERENTSSTICYDLKTLNETLEEIEDNCGSTFFSKQYGSNEWTIFKSNVCDGITCSHKYIPISECLNEENKNGK